MKKLGLIITGTCLWVLLSSFVLAGQDASQQPANPPQVKTKGLATWPQPEQSPNDKRATEYFVLPNQLPVLLISDPSTEKAAAALDVNVGSGDDPLERAGLAHFLEHMLFLGTQKYPEAKEYQEFIQQHGGSHNAYTSLEHTNYFFDISADQLAGGLDRFAQFFIAPLFNEEYVDRERNAVHSEFRAKYTSEYNRQEDVLRQLAPEGHPLSRFRTGNLDTLHNKDGELRKALLRFYNQHYAASNMRLVVVGKEPLSQLKALVTPLFSQVKNFDATPEVVNAPMYQVGLLPASVNIKPYTELRAVSYVFPSPKSTAWLEKPAIYLSHLLGHEGEGSLLWLLQQQGWAETLSASQGFGWRGGDSFMVSIGLTPLGLSKLNEIDSLLFAYIAKIQQSGIQKWTFEELKTLGEIDFNFKEQGDAVSEASHLASMMHEIPTPLLFSVNQRFGAFDAGMIRQIAGLLNPANVLRVVTAPTVDTDQQTALYQTPFKLERDYTPVLNAIPVLQKQLALPLKNPFVPSSLALVKGYDAVPQQQVKSPRFNAWHVTNTEYAVPRAMVRARLKSALVESSAKNAALAAVLAEAINADLNPVTYQAAIAGASFNVQATARGLDFTFAGYSDSLNPLVAYALKNIKRYGKQQGVVVDMARLQSFRESLVRQYRNESKQTPYRQLMSQLAATVYQPYWSNDVMANELEALDLTELASFTQALLQQSEVTVLTGGNLTPSTAKKMAKQLKSVLVQGRNFEPKTQASVVRVTQPRAVNIAAEHKDNAVMLYWQGRDDSLGEQAALKLMGQTLSTPFYHQLRTQQQLGYIVFGSYYPVREMPSVVFLVQSPDTPVGKIHQAIMDFLQGFKPDFATQFRVHQLAVVNELTEKPKNLAELTSDFWQDLNAGNLQFNSKVQLKGAVEALEPEAFAAWYKAFMADASARTLLFYSQNPALSTPKEGISEPFLAVPAINNFTDYKAKQPQVKYP